MNQALSSLFLTAALTLATQVHAQSPPAETADRGAIERVLQTSAQDWSNGDLTAFMQCYENSPDTVFITGAGPLKGYNAIKSHYAASYPATGAHKMGQLSMTTLDYRPLAPAYALVTGRFNLARPAADGGKATGIFTLLLHRTQQGWRISYDHTS